MATTQTQTVAVPPNGLDTPSSEINVPFTLLQDGRTLSSQEDEPSPTDMSTLRRVIIIVLLSGVTLTASIINGFVIVGLPAITKDLALPPSLAFWPASVSGLATASTLLLSGSVADVIGPRSVDLVGCFASGALMVASGAVKKGTELVALRALQGVALSLHLSSSVSIITQVLPRGRGRNVAFACLGMTPCLGFSVGLVLGGVLVDTVGWRVGWYLCGGLTLVLSVVGLWALPKKPDNRRVKDILHDIQTKVDWVGATLASAFMALLCYLLAVLSTDVYRIREPTSIVILCLGLIALPCFIAWMHFQVGRGKPALIPNSLWKNSTFSSICATIALSFAVINSMELFSSLFFQEIQKLSATQASIRILPSTMVGACLNLTMGFIVHRIPAIWIVASTSIICAIAPVLMAVVQPQWTYWANAFIAQLLQPISCDAIFTVGLIVTTDAFPEDTQALAGAVFNTAAQFGGALGLAVLQVVSTMVSKEQSGEERTKALLEGYRASFWTMFAFMILCSVIGLFGLRKTGRVGLKRD
ncbi:hypothetical protein G7046_g2813 [Stylonectria norvegica]|nr:hypothetical protein G7046_g2813 [Stylonectria norvegica]